MIHIEQFNHLLNTSDPNRHQNWQEYRTLVSGYISEYIRSHDFAANTLHVIGVGNSDDLDLSVLTDLFQETTLSDIDIESMRSAVKKYELNQSNLILRQIDYTGLEDDPYWNDFVNQIIQCHFANEIKTYFDRLTKTIKSSGFLADSQNHYDSIIVSPIYTQLLFCQMKEYVEFLRTQKFPEQLIRFLENEILGMIPDVIDSFNQNLVTLLKDKGILFVLSDIFEAKVDSPFYKKAKTALESKKDMDEIYEDYLSEYGVGLGDYGLLSLEKKLRVLDQRWFDWPFDNTSHMLVKLEIFQNR